MRRHLFIIIAILALLASPSWAADETAGEPQEQSQEQPATKEVFHDSGLPVPRFASLASDEVNARSGPGLRYPITWVFRKKSLPVEITREFDGWREIRDIGGDSGWVHKSLLSGERSVIITEERRILRSSDTDQSRPVVRLDPGVVAGLDKCSGGWCKIRVGDYKGWLKREQLWGVYENEQVE